MAAAHGHRLIWLTAACRVSQLQPSCAQQPKVPYRRGSSQGTALLSMAQAAASSQHAQGSDMLGPQICLYGTQKSLLGLGIFLQARAWAGVFLPWGTSRNCMLCHAVPHRVASCSELRHWQRSRTCGRLPVGDVISAGGLGFQQVARRNCNDRASPMQRAGRLVCCPWLRQGLNAPAAAEGLLAA